MEVSLLKQGSQHFAKLSLPAADYALLDALDRAGITNERDIYSVEVTSCKQDYLPQLIPDSANPYELNLLAKRLAALSQWELDCFEGMVMMDTIKTDYAPIQVERLINMTHSISDCQIANSVFDDEQLGRFYVENDFPVIPENLPDAAYDLLNYAEIGKKTRSAEGGVFTEKGYVVHSGEISRQYEPEDNELNFHLVESLFRMNATAPAYQHYLKIAEGLSDLGVRYMPDKPLWNKNMVARILQNKNYLGTEKYPAIIECTLEQKARQMAKPYTHTEPNEIKAIKPLLQCGICGQPLKRRLKASGTERWYCPTDTGHIAISVTDESILREISTLQTHSSETAVLPQDSPSPHAAVSTQAIRLQNEIDRLLEQTPLDAKEIQSKISELAAERYSLCETANHIQDAFIPHHRIEQLAKCVASIQISHNKVIALILKNGKIIKED